MKSYKVFIDRDLGIDIGYKSQVQPLKTAINYTTLIY